MPSDRMPNSSCGNDPFDLDEYWKKRAQIEVKEYDESRKNIQILRNKLLNLDTLWPRTDDTFLSGFLRTRKHNVEKAFKMIKRYYEVRKRYPQFYKLCLPDQDKFIFNLEFHVILKIRDHEGRAILVVRPGNMNPDIVTADQIVRSANTTLQVLVEDPRVQIAGIVMILDLFGFSLYQQTKLISPTNIWVTINLLQDTFPMRLLGIHVVNEPWFFDALYAIFRPFLKEKLRKRIFIHGNDMTSLQQHFPARVLPEEYGGTQPPVNQEHMLDQVRKYNEKLRDWQKFGYRETSRRVPNISQLLPV